MVLLFSCEEQVHWDLDSRELPLLVVDGMITNERKPHRVSLSRTVAELNQPPEPVSNALVAITDGDTIFLLNERPAGTGQYYTDSTVQGVVGKPYFLYVRIEEREYWSERTEMVPVEPLESLNYRKTPENPNLYEFINLETPDPSMTQLYLDWSHLLGGENPDDARIWFRYYTLRSVDVNELFKPDQQRIVFPAGTRVWRTKYSLSSGHQAFIRSLLMETEWKGGVIDVLPANVITNMVGGAVGYFGASTAISDGTVILPLR